VVDGKKGAVAQVVRALDSYPPAGGRVFKEGKKVVE